MGFAKVGHLNEHIGSMAYYTNYPTQLGSILILMENKKNGAQGRNRTADTRIFNPLLYQLSYLGVSRKGRPTGPWKPRQALERPLIKEIP